MPLPKPVFKLIFGMLGALILMVGSYAFTRTATFVSRSVSTSGTVITVVEESRSSRKAYLPVVTFQTADGQEITFKSAAGASPSFYQPGDEVTVLYQPGRPSNAEVHSFFMWLPGCLFMGMGAGIMLFAYYLEEIERMNIIFLSHLLRQVAHFAGYRPKPGK